MPDAAGPERDRGIMDGEHRVQVEMILAVERGLAIGRPLSELQDIVRQLLDYTDAHFMSEQLLMRLYAYPALPEHETAHYRLMEQARRIMEDFCSDEVTLASSELLLLKQWLLDHIRTEDAAFALHLAQLQDYPVA